MIARQPLFVASLFALAGMGAIASAVHAGELDCPKFPEPRDVKLQWVSPHMVFNNRPMSIKQFDSAEKTPENILAFYRQVWQSTSPALMPVENNVAGWQTIAAIRGNCLFTVQVKADGKGSTGLLSVAEKRKGPKLVNSEDVLPRMYGSKVVNDIEHIDDGKTARTLFLVNGFSAEANADFYRQNLGDQGWKAVSSYGVNTPSGPGITLVMRKGVAEWNIVMTSTNGHSSIVANLAENP